MIAKATQSFNWVAAVMGFGLIMGTSCVLTSQPTEDLPTITLANTIPAPTTQTPLPATEESEEQKIKMVVPAGNDALIDGVLAADEWESARQIDLGDESQLFLMHASGYLYIGVRTKPEPVTSICFDQTDQVSILHSSAAIGTAVYRLGDGTWEQIAGFEWCCRDTTGTDQAREERNTHLQEEGWIASNGRMGNSDEVEFQIMLPGDSIRLAVSSIGAPDYETVISSPGDLADDCSNPEMLTGPIPEQAQFNLEDWVTLIMSAD